MSGYENDAPDHWLGEVEFIELDAPKPRAFKRSGGATLVLSHVVSWQRRETALLRVSMSHGSAFDITDPDEIERFLAEFEVV